MIKSPLSYFSFNELLGVFSVDQWLLLGAFFLFALYVVMNLYTDIQYRKTSNIQHLFSLIVGLSYFSYTHQGSFLVLVIMLIGLVFGLILERMNTSSPGDTKMFVVMSVWITSFAQENLILHALIFCTITYSFQLAFSWIAWVRKKGLVKAVAEQKEQLILLFTPGVSLGKEVIFENWPGAVNMCLGAIFTLLAGGLMM
ncbi:hypothetical protein MKY22_17165 [Exiguobacterium sp. FSL W8-0210]|uniref:hypothetical protein n=1 Tax=Exiguobacterium sp. FSL W8-0210 TaxID=2921598 RepID=UPI0030F96FE3